MCSAFKQTNLDFNSVNAKNNDFNPDFNTDKNFLNSNCFQSGDIYSIYYSNLDTFLNKKAEILDLINKESPDIIAFTEILNKRTQP